MLNKQHIMSTTNQITVARVIARCLQARDNCVKMNNTEWEAKHGARLDALVKRYMPSGSGWDCGTKLDQSSTPQKLVFTGSYHHMNENGMYDGWTNHSVIVTPSLTSGLDIRITGRDRNQIKDYLHDTFDMALTELVDEYADLPPLKS